MKIKLMIIALLAVVGLQGSEPKEDTLVLALRHCTDSEVYLWNAKGFKNKQCQRPLVIHLFDDKKDQYSSMSNLENIVANSFKNSHIIEQELANYLSIHLYYDASNDSNEYNIKNKILNKKHDGWIEEDKQFDNDKRLKACIVYHIRCDKESTWPYINNIKSLLEQNPRTPLLVNVNLEAFEPISNTFKCTNIYGTENILNGGESLDALIKCAQDLCFESKVFVQKKSDNNNFSVKSFFENHLGKCMIAGVLIVSIALNIKLMAFLFSLKPKF